MARVCFLLIAIGGLQGAPLPVPKIPTLTHGTYELVWLGTRYTASFAADGHYEAWTEGGARWAGVWHAEKGTLHVGESVRHDVIPAKHSCRWSMRLPGGPNGRIGTSPATITLRRLKP